MTSEEQEKFDALVERWHDLHDALGICHAAMSRHDERLEAAPFTLDTEGFAAELEIAAKALLLPKKEDMLVERASPATDGPGPEGSYCQPDPHTHSIAWYATEVEYQSKILKDAREVLVAKGNLDGEPSSIPQHIKYVFDQWALEGAELSAGVCEHLICDDHGNPTCRFRRQAEEDTTLTAALDLLCKVYELQKQTKKDGSSGR